jgi:hypothetical protein
LENAHQKLYLEIHVTATDDHIGELADGVVAFHYAIVCVVVQVLHGNTRQAVHGHSQHLKKVTTHCFYNLSQGLICSLHNFWNVF